MRIAVMIEDRPDGGIRVWSNDLPGLILSGPSRTKVIGSIQTAAAALLRYQGLDPRDLKIDATFIHKKSES